MSKTALKQKPTCAYEENIAQAKGLSDALMRELRNGQSTCTTYALSKVLEGYLEMMRRKGLTQRRSFD